MPIAYFILFILSLFFLETAFLPGLFTEEISLHISLLLFLTFVYQAWSEWMLGFFIFILLLPFFITQAPLILSLVYITHILLAYFLTQSILGARSFSSFLLYAGIMSFTLSLSSGILFDASWQRSVGHFIFAFAFMLFVKTVFPIRTRSFMSSL